MGNAIWAPVVAQRIYNPLFGTTTGANKTYKIDRPIAAISVGPDSDFSSYQIQDAPHGNFVLSKDHPWQGQMDMKSATIRPHIATSSTNFVGKLDVLLWSVAPVWFPTKRRPAYIVKKPTADTTNLYLCVQGRKTVRVFVAHDQEAGAQKIIVIPYAMNVDPSSDGYDSAVSYAAAGSVVPHAADYTDLVSPGAGFAKYLELNVEEHGISGCDFIQVQVVAQTTGERADMIRIEAHD